MTKEQREAKIAELNWPEAPKLVTSLPGPKGLEMFQEAMQWETIQRPAGSVFPIAAAESFGACFKDVDGNVLIDLAGGVGVKSTGSCHPKVVEAIRKQAGIQGHAVDFATPIKHELVKIMRKTAPNGLKDNCFLAFCQSGTAAGETAIKQAKMITGRNQIVVFEGAYHGVYGHTNAMTTGEGYRHGYGQLMPGIVHLPYPYCYRCPFGMEYPKCDMQCAKYVEWKINTPYTGVDDVAAIVCEGLQGEGGYLVAPKEWWPMLKKTAEKAGALCVCDEVQSGFGRSGKLWAAEYYDFDPDIEIFGKGVGNDMPVTGVMTDSKYWDKLTGQSQPNTFAGNGITMAAAKANFDIMLDPEMNLMARANELGAHFEARMKEAQKTIEQIGDIRGVGLFRSIELVKDPATKEPTDPNLFNELLPAIYSKGVLSIPCGKFANVMRFMPSLTITQEHFDKALDIVIETLGEFKDKMAGKK